MIDRLRRALADPDLVQSFSGVRTCFGEGAEISPEHAALAAFYGYYYCLRHGRPNAPLVLARDPRPTGEAICQALARGFVAAGASGLVNLRVITTPLSQAAIRYFNASGGVIVTASHNPLSDNGWKFLTGSVSSRSSAPEGALLAASEMDAIVADVARAADVGDDEAALAIASVPVEQAAIALLKSGSRRVHTRATDAYVNAISHDWRLDVEDIRRRALGPVLLDPNGGAASGINSAVLEHLGTKVYEINAEVGRPAHPIDTDSINTDTGEHALMRVARAVQVSEAKFGVAFDYDADRGNVVLGGHTADAVVEPQQISALNVALSLARWEAMGRCQTPVRVVASDATSRRVEAVAASFGAAVEWVETGEVNVVTRMRDLAGEGFEVPVGVEGPNGGTVFAGSTCRDGVLTALSCAMALEADPAVPIMLKRLGASPEMPIRLLRQLLDVLPAWTTLAEKLVLDPLAPGEVKNRIEQRFHEKLWPLIESNYRNAVIVNYDGTHSAVERGGSGMGGWRLELERDGARPFIFARGSRTEARVWRLVADSPDPAEAKMLLDAGLDLLSAAGASRAAF